MPPLLCLSPALLDHSFPKDDNELWTVLNALGEIQRHLEEAKIGLVLTEFLRAIAESFDYSRYDECAFLREIVRLIQQWVLQPHVGIEGIDVSGMQDFQPHPMPCGSEGKGLVEIWQDEIGRMLFVHDSLCNQNEFFIGIACDSAFAGRQLGEYNNPDGRRAFPLVGPENVDSLSDAYEWDVTPGIHRKQVTLRDFWRNYRFIGAIKIFRPSGGSHYTVEFQTGKSWPLDENYDPILRDHLRTLAQTAGCPVNVLKDSLVNGQYPRKVCRLRQYQSQVAG